MNVNIALDPTLTQIGISVLSVTLAYMVLKVVTLAAQLYLSISAYFQMRKDTAELKQAFIGLNEAMRQPPSDDSDKNVN